MKQAIVLSVENKYAAVLTTDGLVEKIPDRGYVQGQKISYEEQIRKRGSIRKLAAAAAIAITVLSGSIYYGTGTVQAYSSVKVSAGNAHIELSLNKWDEVISAVPLDTVSTAVTDDLGISLKNRKDLKETLRIIAEKDAISDIEIQSENQTHIEELEDDLEPFMHSGGKTEGALQPQTDMQKQTDPQDQKVAQKQTDPQSQRDAQKQTDPQSQRDAQKQTDPQDQRDAQKQTDPQSQRDAQKQTDPQGQRDAQMQTDVQEQTDPQGQRGEQMQQELQGQTEGKIKPDGQSQPEMQAQPGGQPQPEAQRQQG